MTAYLQRRRNIIRSSKLELYFWLSFPFSLKNSGLVSSFAPFYCEYSVRRQRLQSPLPVVARIPTRFQSQKTSALFSNPVRTDELDDMELWQAGDVEEDLKNLEMALIYMNADQNRYHEERMEALDSFAQSRYPIALHIRRFVLQPLICSFLLALTMQRLRLLRLSRIGSMIQFWTASVMAPCVLLCLILRTKSKSTEISDSDFSDAEYYNNLSYLTRSSKFWSAPSDVQRVDSTSDYVQSLLEQWVSCILGGIVAGASWLVIAVLRPVTFPMKTVLFIQIVTRWGIIASLHQHPSIWYALNRKQQPRPLSWSVWVMQQLIRNQWFTLWATIDVALLALSYPPLYRCYVPAIALVATLWCSIVQSERWINEPNNHVDMSLRIKRRRILEDILTRFVHLVRRVSATSIVLWMWYHSQFLLGFAHQLLESLTATRALPFLRKYGYNFATAVSLSIVLVGPFCHILAVSKLFQASFLHNASLSMEIDQFDKSISPDSNGCSWRWRYRLKWREPKRVRVVLDQWWNRFWYWLLLKGSVEEKLQQESQKLLRGDTSVKSRGLHVLQRVATEPSAYNSAQNRTQWKIKAMERIARKHQADYDRGSFEDPLGVAVYRTLGIGLGFEFDHMKKLNETEVPSVRRLQSRAAKSAIKRVNELYRNATAATSSLEQIDDPIERQRQASIIQQDIDAEIQSLADRLATLVPNGLSSDKPVATVEQYNLETPKRNPGTNQYSYTVPSLQSQSPALRRLFADYDANHSTASYEIDYLNPMGTKSNDTFADDEFIAAWYEQNRGSQAVDSDGAPDDQEDYEETFLV